MFLLKKLSVAHAIKPVSGKVTGIIQNINAVRNSLAHSFFPENRKEYKATGKVLYRKKDIRTPEGLMVFQEDAETAFRHIEERIYGTVD